MSESFAQLLDESFKDADASVGALLQGTVVGIEKEVVLVDVGLKSESAIPIEQFKDANGALSVALGDIVEVVLEALENGYGETVLSREKAKRYEAWRILEEKREQNETVEGMVNGKVKGGFTVDVLGLRAFLPGSLIDVRPLRDTSHLENRQLEFKVIKLDQKRNNLVVSRRAVLEAEQTGEREKLLNQLEEGLVLTGTVKNLTDYGAFVDLGGVDGLLHITDMAWKRVRHPSEVVKVGDEITVKVLKFDRERVRVSLGYKQLAADPWTTLSEKYPAGSVLKGVVANLTDYGCFVGLEAGIEGLVHVSEMDWSSKNVHPSKLVSIGEEVEVMVLDLDLERRRISLGLKQCKPNPWKQFAEKYAKGDVVTGKVKSITEFGVFLGLDNDIDGLVHISDLSWESEESSLLQQFKKGEMVDTVLLQVDPDRERISLGIKQLQSGPVLAYLAAHPVGSTVSGQCIEKASEPTGKAIIALTDQVKGQVSQAVLNRMEQASGSDASETALEFLVASADPQQNAVVLNGPTSAAKPAKAEGTKKLEESSPLNAMSEAFRLAREQ